MRKMQLIVPLRLRKMILTLTLAIASSVWMTNEASNWCMPAAQTSTEQPIRIGGTFQTDIFPCVDETEPCPPCLTIVLASGVHYYLVSDDSQVLAILDTISTGSFAIIEGNHYLEGHYDFIHVTHIFFPETDITQLTGEWEVYKETVSTPTGDADTRWFSTHDVNNTNYIIENNSIYKVVLDQASGYAHYSDIVPYSIDKKENGTWLLTAEGMFSSSDPVGEGIPTPVTIYKLTENEIEWMYAANGGDEGPNYYYQYLRRYTNTQNDRLPSLCDEWNVLEHFMDGGPEYESFKTLHCRLTSDTIFNGMHYVKFEQDNIYKGAMREGANADIYFVPANSTHEYLLYAFNAKTGDQLDNLWFGANEDKAFIIHSATVTDIESVTPRKFVIDFEWQYIYTYASINDTSEIIHSELIWLEGLGFQYGGPVGYTCPFDCAGSPGLSILCAYKNGEQVYVSEMGEQYNCGEDAPDAMFPPETRWNYKHTEMFGGPDDNYVFTLQPMDTIIGNTRYQQIGSFLFRSKGAKVWCAVDSMGTFVERLVYDFDLQVGDSIRAIYGYDEESAGTNPQYAKVTSVEQTYLADGRYARRISYDGFRPDDIEHIGSIEGILTPLNIPVPTCGCSDQFRCCTKSDYLLYEVAQGACDTFILKEQPSDTIPLFSYTGDDPGSSTVDPVDPNQVVATLNGNQLTIHENSGEEINYTLRHNTPAQTPALRMAPKSDSFREEVTISITESGEYTLQLTNPSWGYAIFGQFNYSPQSIDQIPSEENNDESHRKTRKILINGHILIIRGGKTFTLSGQITDGQTTVNRQSKPR